MKQRLDIDLEFFLDCLGTCAVIVFLAGGIFFIFWYGQHQEYVEIDKCISYTGDKVNCYLKKSATQIIKNGSSTAYDY